YNRIARLLRASPEAALFLMACVRSRWVRSTRTNPTKASPQTGPTAQFGRLDGSAVTDVEGNATAVSRTLHHTTASHDAWDLGEMSAYILTEPLFEEADRCE